MRDEQTLLPRLTRRERQVFDGLCVGLSEKQVAALLGISIHTVHTYTKAVYTRFNVHRRGELLSWLLQRR